MLFSYRNDKEWLEHRQIMNAFLLKDTKWMDQLIEMTCDNFTSKIKRIVNSDEATLIENLEDELYLWSIYCKFQIFHISLDSPLSLSHSQQF